VVVGDKLLIFFLCNIHTTVACAPVEADCITFIDAFMGDFYNLFVKLVMISY